ncbi:MAG: DUF4932 domain-containing protein [Bacteroidales bacterium]|nr:DUF4932 domain-containing protein [Bacteroidales bacterium]
MKKNFLLLFLTSISISLSAQFNIKPEVDERQELLSVVFCLAGFEEYNFNGFNSYSDSAKDYFSTYKKHNAVNSTLRS